jgi:hypothetical protein
MFNGGIASQVPASNAASTLTHRFAGECISITLHKARLVQRNSRGRPIASLLFCILLFLARQANAEAPDTITFTSGEQLIGKLVKVLGGVVTFHSDILGDVTVPLDKVKILHAAQFAVIEKNQQVTRKTATAKIPVGEIALESSSIHVSLPKGEERSFPVKDTDLIDAASFNRELHGDSNLLYGWIGSVTLGASLVEGTNSAQTYTGSVAFARSIPTTTWLPAASKTTLNLSGTYGLAKDAQIVSGGNVFQAASTTKTDILHGDTEYDRYFSPIVFGFVSASADHNYGNGLQLQQAYGAGLGWSLLKNPKNDFDLKAELQYQQQQFYNGLTSGLGTPSVNLVGAAVSENWNRTFAHNIKFNEYITLAPTFNVIQAYSAVANANFVFPVYKKLNFTLSSTDNYLGDPPEGYLRNTFQFTAGITYVVK